MLSRIRSHNRIRNVNAELLRLYARKHIHRLMAARPERQAALAICGCQRSGTSVMSRLFFRDLDCTVFREKSRLTGGDEGLRYKPFDEVRRLIAKDKARLVVFKMLVESQRAIEFLDAVPNGKIAWLFRDYRDVVNSNLQKFGETNGIDDLRPVMAGDANNWRSQNCSRETTGIVRRFFGEDMNPRDAAALFWLIRNRLFFEQGLDRNPRVMLVAYESFVSAPVETLRRIYEFCGFELRRPEIAGEVRESSVSKGSRIELSSEIDAYCSQMLETLRAADSRIGRGKS